ncbi:MAG: glycosyltransferase [Lachnospiraceae bacterium]|nr:glycosyltransferase [Lachnospiraceae bacterium]
MDTNFTILIRTYGTNPTYFRDCLESIIGLSYESWNLIVLDENEGEEIRWITEEMFPDDQRVSFRKIKNHHGFAYAYNIGVHFASGDYVIPVGQHDRLSGNMLDALNDNIANYDFIYCDHDELVDMNRMNPHFKPDYNEELLRHTPYIGDFLCFRRNLFFKVGELSDKLEYFPLYDFLFRNMEKGGRVKHLAKLLYHTRVSQISGGTEEALKKKMTREYAVVVGAHLKRLGLNGKAFPDKKPLRLKIDYAGDNYKSHRSEFLFLRDKGVRVFGKNYLQKMYDILSQPDVGIVGVRFERWDFTNDNCGYIFGREGIAYPACYNQSIFQEGYEGRAVIPRDVSMVDFGCAMIDEKLYRKVGGFGANMEGRDIMLDFCLKTREAGRRIIYLPDVVATRRVGTHASSQNSNGLLMERWHDRLKEGDPYYNPNLPMGVENYLLSI